MKLKPLGKSRTELELGRATVLFSYKTPVAAFIEGEGWFRTEEYFSRTTSKHINQWLGGAAQLRPQAWFDNLVATNGGSEK